MLSGSDGCESGRVEIVADHRSLFGRGDMAELRRLWNSIFFADSARARLPSGTPRGVGTSSGTAWKVCPPFSLKKGRFTQQKEPVRYKRFCLPTLS